MKIVALGHQKRVGKNTFANFCAEILRERARGANIMVVNIANSLKNASYMLYSGIGLEHWSFYEEHPDKKDLPLANGKTPRDIYLEIGSILTTYDDTIFISQTLKTVSCDYLFLADVRRKTEIRFLADYPKVFETRIDRGSPQKYGDLDDELLDHDWKYAIDNNGTLQDLYKRAEEFVTEYLHPPSRIPTADFTTKSNAPGR